MNLIVSAYLDFAELQARNRRVMHMGDWIAKLDDFLRLSDQNILTHAGKISHDEAVEHAHRQFAQYEEQRRNLEAQQPTSDFDKAVEEVKRLGQQPPKSPPPSKPARPRGARRPKSPKPSDGP